MTKKEIRDSENENKRERDWKNLKENRKKREFEKKWKNS